MLKEEAVKVAKELIEGIPPGEKIDAVLVVVATEEDSGGYNVWSTLEADEDLREGQLAMLYYELAHIMRRLEGDE